jgi:hypothetical protein
MPDTTIIENLLSLSADEFGKEVLRQSDRTQRDEQVWTVIRPETPCGT